MSAPASTPFRTRASPEDVEVLSPAAATPSPAVGKKKKKKKKEEEEEEEEEVLMAVAEAASETSGDDDQGDTDQCVKPYWIEEVHGIRQGQGGWKVRGS